MPVMVVFSIVLKQNISCKVVCRIAYNGMNVIGIVLCVVVLDQNRRTLNAIVVTFDRLEASRPCKVKVVYSGTTDSLHQRV